MRLLIIEFVGLPGVGKTTTCRAVAESSEVEGLALVPCTSATFGAMATSHLPYPKRKLIAVWRILTSFIRHPSASFLFLRYGLSSRPQTAWKIEQTFSGISMLPRLQAEQVSSRNRAEALLFEQGVVQLLGSLALPGNDRSAPDPGPLIQRVLPGRVDGLVWFENAETVSLERVRNRSHGKSRFDSWSDDEAMKNLRIMQSVLECAVEAAEGAGVPVLRLDPTQAVESNCVRVADWLLGLKRQRLAGPD